MQRLLLLNGPSGSGKDTVTAQLIPYLKFRHMKFADPPKDRLCCILDCDRKTLEEIKDIPHKLLRKPDSLDSRTPREELIYDSEEHWKPRYGSDIFGRIFANRARSCSSRLIIASDCGFDHEVETVISYNGKFNCRIVRLHRTGKDFQSDSRSYLLTTKCRSFDIHNNGSIHALTMAVLRVIIREFPEIEKELLRAPDWIK